MDGLSVLYQSTHSAPLYNIGNAYGWLAKSSKTASAEYHLSGRLYLAKSGWLLLSVPNALVRGVFDAMSHAGAELPLAGTMNVPNVDKELLNAHISVMTADDVEAIGANKINERGHSFKYALGHVKELTPNNIAGVSKLWAIQISSPELSALRKSYGLSALPKDEPFHITVAVRRKNVLRENDVSKFDTASGRGELKAAADTSPIDFDKWHGKAFKIVTTPPGQSVASHTDSTPIPDEPGRVSIVTPENGASWNWPAAPQETVNNFRQNWSSIQGGIPGYKMDQIRRGMGATQIGQPPPTAPAPAPAPALSPAQPIGKVAAAETTYDCNCSGRCTCPPNCVCKKSCCKSSKTAADLLPGGAADNVPDSKFPKKDLALGVKDEREHTSNDQIAKEIAKDHLQEDPAHYEKEELKFVRKTPQIILQLRAAKEHSDNKRYDQKNHILRQLISAAPQDWVVDDPKPYHMGITHAPTNFRFHADPKIIPPVVQVSKAASKNPYIAQLFATAPSITPGNTTWQNVVQHLRNVKTRGDRQAFAEQNSQGLLAELNPEYKQKLQAQITSKNYPRPDFLTRMIQQHGDSALNAVS